MTVLQARAGSGRVNPDDLAAICRAAARLRPGQPVTIMVHGYRYAPGHPRDDPRHSIFSARHALCGELSWPRHLGFREDAAPGLAIGLAWNARGSIIAAHLRAGQAARALASIVRAIRDAAGDCRINAIGHSLGARVILNAVAGLPAGHLSRAVLLCAAAFQADARAALAAGRGKGCEFVNITTRENDLFDALVEFALTAGCGQTIGQGIGDPQADWVDIQIDNADILRRLAALGFPVVPARRRICHWSAYSRPGVFALYRALLTDPVALPLPVLAAATGARQDPRWSRLLVRPALSWPLPFRRGAPS